VSFAAITSCVDSQRVLIIVSVYFVMTQSGDFWIHPRMFVTICNDVLSTSKREKVTKSKSRQILG
jgi:hypothetical protein